MITYLHEIILILHAPATSEVDRIGMNEREPVVISHVGG